MTEEEQLKAVFGDNIPDDLERTEYEDGTVVYSIGKINAKRLVDTAIRILTATRTQ